MVANGGSATVTKLRASDGAMISDYAVGATPRGVAFDGASIWVVNQNSNNVTKLSASDGSKIANYDVVHLMGQISG